MRPAYTTAHRGSPGYVSYMLHGLPGVRSVQHPSRNGGYELGFDNNWRLDVQLQLARRASEHPPTLGKLSEAVTVFQEWAKGQSIGQQPGAIPARVKMRRGYGWSDKQEMILTLPGLRAEPSTKDRRVLRKLRRATRS